MLNTTRLSPTDLEQLAERGIALAEAERQLALLARPAGHPDLVRPCTVGDGIERLGDARVEQLRAVHAHAASLGRVSAFVPASGAATRMFRELLAAREMPGELWPREVEASSAPVAKALAMFVHGLHDLALAPELFSVLDRRGHKFDPLRLHGPWRPILDALLDPTGMDAARMPKGLLPFQRRAAGARTAFEEHLVEACALASDADGTRVLDVTVSGPHRAAFERLLTERIAELTTEYGGRWRVTFSEQHPSTDTLAGDPAGGPFRDEHGRLLFRPAGHGALISNLGGTGRDLVFVKNIDNVAADYLKPETARWSGALVGLAAEWSAQVHGWCARLAAGEAGALGAARAFASSELGIELPAERDAALARLDRPMRVCGMVANKGEPGGGPFWVRDDAGVSRQIVESAQVDHGSSSQMAILHHSTHFNPVFLAVSLRDAQGRPHDLSRFVDDSAVIVTKRSHGSRELLALERPGLWNGAMARWHTRFVEVPLAVFNPVKTVIDLLRPEHQG